MKKRAISPLIAAALLAVMVAAPAQSAAGGTTVTVFDPVGDTTKIGAPGTTPAFLDIIRVEVSKQSQSFEFSMTLAAPVPDQPVLPKQVKEFEWFWPIDTDPATFPFGFPRAPGLAFPPEFLLAVAWDGIDYSAFVIDRPPNLERWHARDHAGRHQCRATVTAVVDVTTLDDPASFGFSGYTRAWFGPRGTEGFAFADVVGNPGVFHPWP
ncbi:MAG TPA: hypothetical protein VM848_19720 [Acidimicrobiia bacterium]|nr:hypothetical protein [Acidimicrobiia bacterium]